MKNGILYKASHANKHKQKMHTTRVIGIQLRGNPLKTFCSMIIGDDKIWIHSTGFSCFLYFPFRTTVDKGLQNITIIQGKYKISETLLKCKAQCLKVFLSILFLPSYEFVKLVFYFSTLSNMQQARIRQELCLNELKVGFWV